MVRVLRQRLVKPSSLQVRSLVTNPLPAGDRPGGIRNAEDLDDLQVEICEDPVEVHEGVFDHIEW